LPDDDTLGYRRVRGDPRSLANVNGLKLARASAVGSIDLGVVCGNQHGVWSELCLVLQDDSSASMQPATRRDENIVADLDSIGKIDGHMPRDL
jgi:hypothetical protein